MRLHVAFPLVGPTAHLCQAIVMAVVALGSNCVEARPDDSPRLVIPVFKYSGVHGAAEKRGFEEFNDIIRTKISILSEELGFLGNDFTYLSHLRPDLVKDGQGHHVEFSGSNADLLRYWRVTDALGVFDGRIRRRSSDYEVRTRVFFGDLSTAWGRRFLSIGLPIRDEQFETTKDSHSAAIIYALALDSLNRCRPEHEILNLVGKAFESLKDVPDAVSGVAELRSAVRKLMDIPLPKCEGGGG